MAQLNLEYIASPTIGRFIRSDKFYAVCCGARGSGKCLQIGTQVLRYDGALVAVEDVQPHDLLMGDDNTPREVISTTRGEADLFEIVPFKGSSFTVTDNHIMSLHFGARYAGAYTRNGREYPKRLLPSYGQTRDFPLTHLLTASPTFFNKHRLLRAAADFAHQPVDIDPYFFGVWLGDGTSENVGVTTMDPEIVDVLYHTAAQWQLGVKVYTQANSRAKCYRLTDSEAVWQGHDGRFIEGRNPLYAAFRRYGLLALNHQTPLKYIPDVYLHNDRETRLQLLAGLIDTDGALDKNNDYEITQKNENIADGIVFIARSLGLAAYKAKAHKSSQSGTTGSYYRVTISGDCNIIPVCIPRKKAAPRQQIKNVLHTGIRTIEHVGVGEFAGFELSGNGRFLLGDFTVTHNSTAGLMRTIIRANQLPPQYHPLRWAVVRDTRKNIGLTVARTIRKWCPEPYAKWRGKPEEPESCVIYIKGKPLVHFDFFGVNSPGDHDRFQSYEASGGIWLEEPCPLATNTEFVASGIAESVLASAQTSVRGGPNPSIQITMNPPSADHWTAQLFHLPGYEAAGDDEMEMSPEAVKQREIIRASADVFMVPPSECAAEKETPGYTERNRQILMATGRTDLLARLVDGRIGYAQVGERVTPEFSSMHIVNGLTTIPRVPIILAFDFGLNATCIAAQVSPQGYLHILRAWTRENAGMKQLLQTDVQPWLAQQPVESWWYCGGPEAREREQSDSEETALRMIVNTLGNAPYRAGPVSWSARRDALRDALTRTPGGLTWVRVSQQGAALLIRALDGGWHYPTDSMGHIRNNGQPDKRSKWDHLGDACSHLFAVLLKKTDSSSRSVQRPRSVPTRFNHTQYTSVTRTGV